MRYGQNRIEHLLLRLIARARRSGAGQDGQYVAGGGSNPSSPSVWDVPVVRTPSIAEGDALLVDTSRVRILDREQATVMISIEDRDNFVKNLVTMEMRGAVACYDEGGMGSSTCRSIHLDDALKIDRAGVLQSSRLLPSRRPCSRHLSDRMQGGRDT